MNPVVLPWLAEIVLISWRSLSGEHFVVQNGKVVKVSSPQTVGDVKGFSAGIKRPPLPSELLTTFIIFGAYGLIGEGNNESRRRIASLLGWGTVLATFLLMASSGSVNTGTATPTGGKK